VVIVGAAASFLPPQSAGDAGGRSDVKSVQPARGKASAQKG
jgi:hypothetical protein